MTDRQTVKCLKLVMIVYCFNCQNHSYSSLHFKYRSAVSTTAVYRKAQRWSLRAKLCVVVWRQNYWQHFKLPKIDEMKALSLIEIDMATNVLGRFKSICSDGDAWLSVFSQWCTIYCVCVCFFFFFSSPSYEPKVLLSKNKCFIVGGGGIPKYCDHFYLKKPLTSRPYQFALPEYDQLRVFGLGWKLGKLDTKFLDCGCLIVQMFCGT